MMWHSGAALAAAVALVAFAPQPAVAVNECPSGQYYSNSRGCDCVWSVCFSTCWNCNYCPSGKYKSGYNSRSCSSCGPGYYNARSGSASCSSCNAGKYSSSYGATSSSTCSNCPRGKYQYSTGQSACRSCPTGKTTSSTGATSSSQCLGCPAGQGWSSSYRGCRDCPSGSYSSSVGSSCSLCAAGKYQSWSGRTRCDSCRSGTFSTTVGASSSYSCSSCPRGTYQAYSASSSCYTCSSGLTTTSTGATSSSSCVSEAQANRENGDVSGDEGINLKGGEIAAIVAGALFAVFGVILAVRTSTRKRRSAGGAGNGSTPPSKLDSVVVGGTNPMRTGKSGTAAAIDMKGIGMAAGTKTGSAHIPAAKKAPVPLVAVKKTSVAAGATTEPRTVSAHQPVAKKIVTTAVVVKKASTTASSAAGASKETLDPTPVAKTPAPPVAEGKAGRAPVVKSTPPAAPAATSVVVNPAAIQVLEKLKKKVLFHKVELTIAALLLTSLGLWIGALAAPTWATFVHPDGEDGSGTFRDIMKMLGHDPFKATLGPFKYAYDGPSIRTTIRVGSWSMPLPSVLTDFGLEESGDSAVFVDDWCDDNLSSALNLVFKGAQDGISGAASSAFSSIFGDGGGGNTETGQLGEGCSESKAGIWCARIFGVLAALMTALAIYRLWNVGVDADYLKSRCWSSAALQALALALFAVFLGGYDKSAPGDVEWEIGPGFKAGIAAAVLAVVAPLLERFEPGT